MSTLPPPPTINTTVPVIGPESGKESSYSDPNSSASIMRTTALLGAQAEADTKYDIKGDVYKKDKFTGQITSPFLVDILFFFTGIITLLLFFIPHKPYGKAYLLLLSLSILTIYLLIKKNYV